MSPRVRRIPGGGYEALLFGGRIVVRAETVEGLAAEMVGVSVVTGLAIGTWTTILGGVLAWAFA